MGPYPLAWAGLSVQFVSIYLSSIMAPYKMLNLPVQLYINRTHAALVAKSLLSANPIQFKPLSCDFVKPGMVSSE